MNQPLDTHELINQLTRTQTHREPYTTREGGTIWTRHHITTVPSLIAQLQTATPASAGDATASGGYRSRPAAWLEALDTLIHIDLAAAAWVRDLGHDDPGDTLEPGTERPVPGSGTLACLRLLGSLHPSTHHCDRPTPRRDRDTARVVCCTRHAIEVDVRRWWTQARVITGWDSTAWRPDNTCPACGTRGVLRVRFSTQSAFCVSCRETWTPDVIGLLAEHIRFENADQDAGDHIEEAS